MYHVNVAYWAVCGIVDEADQDGLSPDEYRNAVRGACRRVAEALGATIDGDSLRFTDGSFGMIGTHGIEY